MLNQVGGKKKKKKEMYSNAILGWCGRKNGTAQGPVSTLTVNLLEFTSSHVYNGNSHDNIVKEYSRIEGREIILGCLP